MNLESQRVTVVGMGASGVAAAALLAKEGAKVLIIDDQKKERPSILNQFDVEFHLGTWSDADLFSAELVVVSPGVPLKKLPVKKLSSLQIPVISEIELAARQLSAPMIAITGTNGKSTTTTLVGEILKNWGWRVFVGGNLGVPLSCAVGSEWDFIVVEVSSFQLETICDFHPRIAALLNVTPDHMDRYPDFGAYQETKWRIFENQQASDYCLFNEDDPMTVSPFLRGAPVFFSKSDVPRRGVYLNEGKIVSNIWGEMEPVIPLSELKVKGTHNLENVMAASAIALICGCSTAGIHKVVSDFRGLPHRMELVREVGGVKYVNDSKGTNVGAVIKSLEGAAAPVVLIAGGRDKESDFTPLQEVIKRKVKRLILIGEAQDKMARCFSGCADIKTVGSMKEAVSVAASCSEAGEMVLLSPACASFDMFRDYQARGDAFRKAVECLSNGLQK